MVKFISLGGACHSRQAFSQDEAYPFDSIRSQLDGIVDCINTNFANFFPKILKADDGICDYPYNGKSFRGKYFGFYHHNLKDDNVIQAFHRRFERFDKLLTNATKEQDIVFVRTSILPNYEDDIKHIPDLHAAILGKYPGSKYRICYIIPDQDSIQYYKRYDDKTYIFTITNPNTPHDYKVVYNMFNSFDFARTPSDNEQLVIKKENSLHQMHGLVTMDPDN